jgi:hypothetical protein
VGLKQPLVSVPAFLSGSKALLTTLNFLRMAPCETPGLTGGRTLSKANCTTKAIGLLERLKPL